MACSSTPGLAAPHATGGADAATDDALAARHVSVARFLGLFGRYAGRVAFVLLLIALASAMGLAAPFLLREIIDVALPRGDLPLLAVLAASLIGLAAIGAVIGVFEALVTHTAGEATATACRLCEAPTGLPC